MFNRPTITNTYIDTCMIGRTLEVAVKDLAEATAVAANESDGVEAVLEDGIPAMLSPITSYACEVAQGETCYTRDAIRDYHEKALAAINSAITLIEKAKACAPGYKGSHEKARQLAVRVQGLVLMIPAVFVFENWNTLK